MRHFICLVIFQLSPVLYAANPWSPTIDLGSRTITVNPSKLHSTLSKSKLEIVETEGCEAKVQSSSVVQFGEGCDFLRGVYQYSFRQPGSDRSLRLYSEFFLHQKGSKSRVFLVNSPIVIHEGRPENL